MSILLLGVGGGGGSILRSVKELFRRDVAIAQKTDPKYADRVRRAVTARFLDTNAFSLSDVPPEERLMIGARTTGQLGARHDPEVARQALEESRAEVEALLAAHMVVILIGTGGKGTGAGTLFPIAQMARAQRKLVIPIFVQPSFERHEVDKRRYDHALGVVTRFDEASIRLIEILNDQGYADSHPEPQSVVWERMNLPIARGLRGLIYVLSDLSQVDPSDLSTLLAGPGRLRIGYAELDPPAGGEPGDQHVGEAVARCWTNSYYQFSRPVGTSLVCIQGDWSNVTDARIKGGLAALAAAGEHENHYTPLFARAPRVPRPWGVTALFAEYTGIHPPLDVDWAVEQRLAPIAPARERPQRATPAPAVEQTRPPAEVPLAPRVTPPRTPASFANLWEFAVAVNRGNADALALARGDATTAFAIEAADVRKLLRTVWFRSVVALLSSDWRERLLDALVANAPIPDHLLKVDRRELRLSQVPHAQLQDVAARSHLDEAARADIDLLITVSRLWGVAALERFEFVNGAAATERSRLASALLGFRK